jgi:hypothetical protein
VSEIGGGGASKLQRGDEIARVAYLPPFPELLRHFAGVSRRALSNSLVAGGALRSQAAFARSMSAGVISAGSSSSEGGCRSEVVISLPAGLGRPRPIDAGVQGDPAAIATR